jgi:glycosyltransferase involved in cell wall biosynthesis
MKFTIITHVNHIKKNNQYFGYAPYIREMNIWFKYVDDVIVVAHLENKDVTAIDFAYDHEKIDFKTIPNFNFIGFKNIFLALLKLPKIFWKIFWAMNKADHIHLRCPGNVGLIGCLVQILYPNKIKTAKYAGNWDRQSKQPWTYRLQKYILNNTFLTKNMQVLVYGEWENQSKNIKPFFTATYSELEKEIIQKENFSEVRRFLFIGSLVIGKNPMFAIQLIANLNEKKRDIILDIYGDGLQRTILEDYIKKNKLGNYVFLHGNQNQETIKKAYQKSHFVILPSKSEGWPKAVAEGMFWGCVPIASKVSCVPFMLDYGNRGVLLEMDLKKDVEQIEKILVDENIFFAKSKLASDWSKKYTTDIFEAEIKKLLIQ